METLDRHGFQPPAESRRKSLTARMFRGAVQGLPGIHVHKPPVPHLLRSNTAPTEAEASLINLAIGNAYLLRTRFHRIISGSETHGDWRDRIRLTRAITQYNFEVATDFIEEQYAILSPIRKLCPEVLEAIFLRTLPSCLMDLSGRRRRNADLPWALSQVCQSWRSTALLTPALWTKFPTVNLSADSTGSADYRAFLVRLLKRARHVVLHIFVDKDGKFGDDTDMVLDVLVAHSTKWKGIFIEAPFSITFQLSGIKERLPELEWLYLRGFLSVGPQDAIESREIDFFRSAPKLRVARVEGEIYRNAPLPYSQLTDYSQGNGHEHRLKDLLATRRPQLQRFSVRNFCESATFRDMTMVNTISNLTKFEFEFAFELRSFQILDTFDLIPAVSSLILRSQSSALRYIYLRTQRVTPGELNTLLQNAPAVEHLNITIPPAQDITYLLYHPDVAPCLRTCGFYTDNKLSHKLIVALRSFAKSCCEEVEDTVPDCNALYGLRRLQTVYLHSPFCYPPLEEKQRQLEGWNSTTETSDYLKELRRGFFFKVPEITMGQLLPQEKPRTLPRQKDPVNRLLVLTEELAVTELADIYASGIHLTLRSLSRVQSGKYREPVERIFDKWKRLIDGGSNELRWVMLERDTLIYLSKHNEVRRKVNAFQMTDPRGLRRMDIPLDDLPWLNV
ncbi:hypothetical protein M413DRAFT_31295 [Hebeloma cylindrosporum]|uniref:F-box domain-containing protein n=1 Tax=Hebeloma cylindrosporum TaxID=76867 RepID=A0A0C2XG59_HEBCY|nr:hypothetical protein M413DRAFT_31295 [Hebeloma cylindrosporum h7]